MSEPIMRSAEFQDIPTLALYRRKMFEDMEAVEKRGYDSQELRVMEVVFAEHLRARLGEEVRAWVYEVEGRIVACAAVSVLPYPPGPGRLDMRIVLLHNVYTLENFRHQGMARKLVETAMEWCRQQGFERLVLNASDAGRPLYESLGFHSTNQMSAVL